MQHTNTSRYVQSSVSITETLILFLNYRPIFCMLSPGVIVGVKGQKCLPFLLLYWNVTKTLLLRACLRYEWGSEEYNTPTH